ncbi:MAG TPA: hypothetical protein VFY89_03175 [Ktedonobacterales bacterium]
MADMGWGHGGAAQQETGLNQVLAGYAARGGQLYGARRWPENPLTLTHLLWQGPDGFTVEAARHPTDEASALPEEREIWVQLALHCPTPQAPVRPEEAPWLPIQIEPGHVAEMLRAYQRARASHWSNPQGQSGGYVPGGYSRPGSYPTGPAAADRASPYDLGPIGATSPRSRPLRGYSPSAPSMPEPLGGAGSRGGDPSAWTGSWQRGQFETPEVSVLTCVEVEMPMLLGDPATAEGIRDFTRDVAINFSRACKSIPQVREVRGWMNGALLILAARMSVAQGTRPPTHAEMEGAAHILADALAQRTLPYSRLGFADPGAWAQGTPLPE